jgi:hypothetical protein
MDLQEMLSLATELGHQTGSVTFDQLDELGLTNFRPSRSKPCLRL